MVFFSFLDIFSLSDYLTDCGWDKIKATIPGLILNILTVLILWIRVFKLSTWNTYTCIEYINYAGDLNPYSDLRTKTTRVSRVEIRVRKWAVSPNPFYRNVSADSFEENVFARFAATLVSTTPIRDSNASELPPPTCRADLWDTTRPRARSDSSSRTHRRLACAHNLVSYIGNYSRCTILYRASVCVRASIYIHARSILRHPPSRITPIPTWRATTPRVRLHAWYMNAAIRVHEHDVWTMHRCTRAPCFMNIRRPIGEICHLSFRVASSRRESGWSARTRLWSQGDARDTS